MRLVSVLASVAIAFAAAMLPASLTRTLGPAASPQADDSWATAPASDSERSDGTPFDTTPLSAEDDDLDERDDALETLAALPNLTLHTWSPLVGVTHWQRDEHAAPPTPHLESTLRPPIGV